MLKKQHRHTSSVIAVPPILEEISYQHNSSNKADKKLPFRHGDQQQQHTIKPLCKISFSLDGDQSLGNQFSHTVHVYEGMTIVEITEEMCRKIGCDYEECIEEIIKQQLLQILSNGGSGVNMESDQIWRMKMEKIILETSQSKVFQEESCQPQPIRENQQEEDISCTVDDDFHSISFSNKTNKYFQNTFTQQLQNRNNSLKRLHNFQYQVLHEQGKNGNREVLSIYDRSLLKKKETKQKLIKIKQEKEQYQLSKCTFKPHVNQKFIGKSMKKLKKNQSSAAFFRGKQNQQKQKTTNANDEQTKPSHHNEEKPKNAFKRLYEHSFELRTKQRQKLRTLQNEEESKIAQLSFIPEINECSREICRIRSHASFISNISSVKNQIYEIQETQKQKQSKMTKETSKNASRAKLVREKKNNLTFHPQISENTKRLTQNLPSFQERLEISSKKMKESKSGVNIGCLTNQDGCKVTAKKKKDSQKMKIKKQTYFIDDSMEGDEFFPQKTEKKSFPVISPSNFRKEKNQNKRQSSQISLNSPQTINISSYLNNSMEEEESSDKKDSAKQAKSQKIKKRAEQLYNSRKKLILEAIYYYLAQKKPHSTAQFSQKYENFRKIKQTEEISFAHITLHPFIPDFIKKILDPVTLELADTGLTLEKEEFIWAIQKLYEGLSVSDKGSLLGWGVKLLPDQIK